MIHQFRNRSDDIDFQEVISTFVALGGEEQVTLGVDLGRSRDDSYVIFGLGEAVYRLRPDLALRLAAYIEHVVRTESIEDAISLWDMAKGIRAIAQGLGVTVPLNN